MAADILSKDLITYNPLSETTRKERTSLLGLSMIGIALVKVPLVPEKFSALGVEFGHVNQEKFVELYALVVVYYVVAFTLYALSDFFAWQREEVIRLSEYTRQHVERKHATPPELEEVLQQEFSKDREDPRVRPGPAYRGPSGYWPAFYVTRTRALFEFLMPLFFAAYSLSVLHAYTPK